MVSQNKLLGQFDLADIAPAPKGVPQIEVIFDIDQSGLVHVTAKDKGTGKMQNVVIQSSGGLSKAQMEEMIREAEANKEEDAKRRELVELKNDGDKALHNTEKSLNEHKSKLSQDVIAEIEKELAALRTTLSNSNLGLEEVDTLRT